MASPLGTPHFPSSRTAFPVPAPCCSATAACLPAQQTHAGSLPSATAEPLMPPCFDPPLLDLFRLPPLHPLSVHPVVPSHSAPSHHATQPHITPRCTTPHPAAVQHQSTKPSRLPNTPFSRHARQPNRTNAPFDPTLPTQCVMHAPIHFSHPTRCHPTLDRHLALSTRFCTVCPPARHVSGLCGYIPTLESPAEGPAVIPFLSCNTP